MGQNQQTTNQQQQQNQQTNPWAPAIPALTNLISQIGGINTAPTASQTAATNALVSAAGGLPNFGGMGTDVVGNLYGSSTAPQGTMLADAYNQLQQTTSPYLAAGYTNPTQNPLVQNALSQIQNSAVSNVEGQFAAAGRDPLGNTDAAKTMGKAIGASEAPILLGEQGTLAGQQMGALSALTGGAQNLSGAEIAAQQTPLQNQIAAMQAAGQIPGLYTQPAGTLLSAANTAYGLPFSNLQAAESMFLPIAGMGGQSTGQMTGTSTTTQPINPWTTALGLGLAGASIAGQAGMFSDIRLKEDIEPVGMLFDGLPVYKFRYLSDPITHIGVMAQDVEQIKPEAVGEVGGFKTVNYSMLGSQPTAWAA